VVLDVVEVVVVDVEDVVVLDMVLVLVVVVVVVDHMQPFSCGVWLLPPQSGCRWQTC